MVRRLSDGEKIKPNRRLSAFFICVFVSALFWFLNALSKKYNDTITVSLSYINLPADKFLVNKLPDRITMQVNAQGFYLLSKKLSLINDVYVIDASELKYKSDSKSIVAIYTPLINGEKFGSQFNADLEIQRIFPDTIYFYFGNKKSKTIPVKLLAKIDFEQQFQLKNQIKLQPSEITVQGPEQVIDSVNFLETEFLNLKGVNKNMFLTAKLRIPIKFKDLEVSNKSIDVSFEVEKYTEAETEVPLKVINLPDNYSIKTFPDKIKIAYLVAFSKFSQVKSADFSVKADFSKLNGQNRIPVEVNSKPDFIQIVKVNPTKVEYIFTKR